MVTRIEIPVISLDDIRQVVREELDRLRLADALVDAKEAADLLGVKPRTIWDWRKQGRLPYVEISPSCYRFRKSDIEQFLAKRTRREPTSAEFAKKKNRNWRGGGSQ